MGHDKVLRLVVGSLLMALSLVIPLSFGGVLGIVIPPFTATLASHVPTFLAMLYGPLIAGIVGLGSAVGFFLRLGPIVGLRAAMHIPLGIAGALLLKKRYSFPATLGLISPLHAGLEALVVLPFGYSLKDAGWLVGVGTLLHHVLDSTIAIVLWKALSYSKVFPAETLPER